MITIQNMFTRCGSLITVNNANKLGSLTATPLVDGSGNLSANQITSLSFGKKDFL